jgi:hypothetical protein
MRTRTLIIFLLAIKTGIYAQPNIIQLNSHLTGNIDTVARDAVYMNPGFSYLPSTGYTFTARTDNNLIVPTIYISENELPDPQTRVLNKALNVGNIPGYFQIGNLGAAIYEIPIAVPPGTNGISPEISISYNSQSANGILGYGWHIQGLSSIYRTGKKIHYDGQVSPVRLNSGDRFELDGTRMLLYSGTYGYGNSVYRLEGNPGIRVTAYGSLGDGPQYFKTETKDGLLVEHGNTADSRVDLNGSGIEAAEWKINRVTDLSGNYMSFSYQSSEGEHYIRSIKYTGNGTSLTPYDSVVFRYEDRTVDVCKYYLAGESFISKKLLRNIAIYSEGIEIRNYDFAYSGQLYSKLVQIDRRNRIGETVNPTIIKWGARSSFSSGNNIFLPATYDESLIAMSDYNLDGKDDFVTWVELPGGGTRWALYTNNGDGNYSLRDEETTGIQPGPVPYEVIRTPYEYNFSATYDYTGDGRPDVVMRAGDSLICYTSEINGSDLQLIVYPNDYLVTPGLSDSYTGDFNGDGIDEILAIGSSSTSIHSFALNETWTIYLPGNNIRITDVNGDSKPDLIIFESEGYEVYEFFYDGAADTFSLGLLADESNRHLTSSTFNRIVDGDFNGDGNSDFLVRDSTAWSIMLSTGKLFENSEIQVPLPPQFDPFVPDPDKSLYVRDINNDNKSDIIAASTVYNGSIIDSIKLEFFIFSGSGFTRYSYSIDYSRKALPGSLLFGDFMNDSSTDALLFMSKVIQTGGLENTNLVSLIADGLNNKTSFSYNKAVVPDPDLTRPVLTSPLVYITTGFTVVDTVRFDTESELLTIEKYSYANPVYHLKGKGVTGFANMTRKNVLTGIKEVSRSGVNLSKAFTYVSQKQVIDGTGSMVRTVDINPVVTSLP